VRSWVSVIGGGILQMKIGKETIGTAVKLGVVYGVLTSVVILCALIVLVEVFFALLMSLTTLLREKTMTAVDWIAATCNRFVTNATTSRLWKKSEDVEKLIEKMKTKLKS
jgi:glycerol-3-phosphate acyltransferase PlsY